MNYHQTYHHHCSLPSGDVFSPQDWSTRYKYTNIPYNNHGQNRVPIQIPKWEIEKLSNKFSLPPTRESVGIFWNVYSARKEKSYMLANEYSMITANRQSTNSWHKKHVCCNTHEKTHFSKACDN